MKSKVQSIIYYIFLLNILLLFTSTNTIAQGSSIQGGGGWLIAQGNINSTSNNIVALYANPAFLADIENKWGVDLSFRRNFNISDLDTYSAGAYYKIAASTLGLSYVRYGNEFLSEQKIGFNYGRSLFSKLDIGARLNFYQLRQSEFENASSLTFELGLSSKVSKKVTFGALISNPISQKLNDSYRIPTLIAIGVDYHPSKKVSLKGELAKSIKDPLTVRIGITYTPIDNISMLIGSDIGARQVGVGVRFNMGSLTVNGGYGINQVLNNTPALSFSYQR